MNVSNLQQYSFSLQIQSQVLNDTYINNIYNISLNEITNSLENIQICLYEEYKNKDYNEKLLKVISDLRLFHEKNQNSDCISQENNKLKEEVTQLTKENQRLIHKLKYAIRESSKHFINIGQCVEEVKKMTSSRYPSEDNIVLNSYKNSEYGKIKYDMVDDNKDESHYQIENEASILNSNFKENNKSKSKVINTNSTNYISSTNKVIDNKNIQNEKGIIYNKKKNNLRINNKPNKYKSISILEFQEESENRQNENIYPFNKEITYTKDHDWIDIIDKDLMKSIEEMKISNKIKNSHEYFKLKCIQYESIINDLQRKVKEMDLNQQILYNAISY